MQVARILSETKEDLDKAHKDIDESVKEKEQLKRKVKEMEEKRARKKDSGALIMWNN